MLQAVQAWGGGRWQELAVSKQHVLGFLHIHRSRHCSSALLPLEQVGAKNRLLVFMGRITHQKG
jgi:hypothetical protein